MPGDRDSPRNCGKHCPVDNVSHSTTKKCRICKNSYHMPCYGILASLSKMFPSECPNIVFICDECDLDLDNEKSPKRKPTNPSVLKQSVLASNVNGNVGLTQQQQQQTTTTSSSKTKATNEQLMAMMKSMTSQIAKQMEKLIEIGGNVDVIGDGVMQTNKKTEDVFNLVSTRASFRGQQDMRNLSNEMFRPQNVQNKENVSQTPTGSAFGGRNRTYSTVVSSKLPVTPRSETPSLRKREKHISLKP